jgi:hypothetical protein
LGPAFDGGYYLVGLKKPRNDLFQGIRWSSSGELLQTMAKAKKTGMSVGLLKEWYDVDDKKSLALLMKDIVDHRLKAATYTRRALACMNLKPATR